ncbi:MAG: DNA gyrase inhibitor YacG [Rhodospirillaceae bacterium]|nr:DNA gyrase inhibitor YacG [Rhodospirillaceae bacterium]
MKMIKKPSCPICNRVMEREFKPFCSAKCKLIDLGSWLGGDYRLPSDEMPGEAEIIDIASRMEEK